jgi:HD-like signal output (HDOD) protein
MSDHEQLLPRYRLDQHPARFEAPPPLSTTAIDLIGLRSRKNVDAQELIAIIERDPPLAAVIMRQAGSAVYHFRGTVDGVEQAVIQILGYEAALSIALSVSMFRTYRRDKDIEHKLAGIKHHAVLSAIASRLLAHECGAHLKPGLAYVGALLQDFGYFVLAHRHPSEIEFLLYAAPTYAAKPVLDIERHVIGLHHAEFGARLLEVWHLPETVVEMVRAHHDELLSGDEAPYVAIVQAANYLLGSLGLAFDTSYYRGATAANGLAVARTVIDLPDVLLKRVGDSLHDFRDEVREMSRAIGA